MKKNDLPLGDFLLLLLSRICYCGGIFWDFWILLVILFALALAFQDCAAACGPPVPPIQPPKPCTLFGIDCLSLIMAFIFGLFFVVFWGATICHSFIYKHDTFSEVFCCPGSKEAALFFVCHIQIVCLLSMSVAKDSKVFILRKTFLYL